jgi:hypothetical protein
MSAVDGVPVDKCPKCGMPSIPMSKCLKSLFGCGSYISFEHQSLACKRIAELETMQPFREMEKYRARIVELEEEVGRLRELVSANGLGEE